MSLQLPKLYAILDVGVLDSRGYSVEAAAEALCAAGVRLLQYRDKTAPPQEVLRRAAVIATIFEGAGATLILNDRADLAALAGWNGVHVGQEDLPPDDAHAVLGTGKIVGVSTHTKQQVLAENAGGADYLAIGPVFATGTKLDAADVVGLEGTRRARALTTKPLVAIGGITRANVRSVIDAGADSVAVISGLFAAGEPVERVARDFLDILR